MENKPSKIIKFPTTPPRNDGGGGGVYGIYKMPTHTKAIATPLPKRVPTAA